MVKNMRIFLGGSLAFALFFIIMAAHGVSARIAGQPLDTPSQVQPAPAVSLATPAILPRVTRPEENQPLLQRLTSQANTDVDYAVDAKTNKFTFMAGRGNDLRLQIKPKTTDAAVVAHQFMKEYGSYFGVQDTARELKVIKKDKDELGMSHVRYNQVYNDVPVFGAQAIVHLNKNLSVTSVNGQMVPMTELDTAPSITQNQAIDTAKELWTRTFHLATADRVRATLYVLNKGILENKIDETTYLVWRVELYHEKPLRHEFYFIDAHTGQLVYQITGVQDAVDRWIYDCSPGDGWCYVDTLMLGYTYGRSEGQPARGANPGYGGTDVDDLYSLIGSSHNYYAGTFGRNGANNSGGIGDGSVDYPAASTSVFAYIEGYGFTGCPNAFFDGANHMEFCQGMEVTDVTGHEYTHAVGYFSILDGSGNPAGLTYTNESGALNESYSDIFGEAIEYYVDGTSDWLVGEDVNIGGLVGPLRSMSDPSSLSSSFGPYPDRFNSSDYYCGSSDGGGVHHNSSVPNHAAYLMAVGGTFNGYTITGIGRAKEEAIFYRALTTYLTTSSGFNAAYNALITSCNDLYGSGSDECQQVTGALQAVEMNRGGACMPSITNISSDKADGHYRADDVIDIDLSFSSAVSGSGTVTLDSGGSCSFTVTNAIAASCDYTVSAGENSADLTVTSISGTVTNQDGEAMTDFTPTTNLATNKNIIIDTTPPSVGTVTINNDATYTNSSTVTLTLAADDTNGITWMIFANSGGDWSDWEAYATSKTWTIDSSRRGTKTVYAQFSDPAGNILSTAASDTIIYLKPAHILAVPGPGGDTLIKAFSYSGVVRSTPKNLYAFDRNHKGGIHIAACDVDADGIDEIITAVGAGLEPWVKVVRQNGQPITRFLAYGTNIRGGVFLACGDLNGDGKAEIVTGVPEGFGPHVRIFNGQTGKPTISNGFFAYAKNVRTGIRVATGDLDGDGKDEIITGTGQGGGPHVRTFSATGQMKFTPGFFVYEKTDRTGIKVAAGDVNGDGQDEIITGSGKGRPSEVKIYTRYGKELKKLSPYGTSFKNGVKVSAGDLDADGVSEIVTSTEANSAPYIRSFKMSGGILGSFYSLDKNTRYGAETAVAALD